MPRTSAGDGKISQKSTIQGNNAIQTEKQMKSFSKSQDLANVQMITAFHLCHVPFPPGRTHGYQPHVCPYLYQVVGRVDAGLLEVLFPYWDRVLVMEPRFEVLSRTGIGSSRLSRRPRKTSS